MRFERSESIPDVVVVTPTAFEDSRGYFFESWQARKFAAGGIDASFVQDNQSGSVRHTLRGLHYQVRAPQGKLVRVLTGAVFDVAVDVRRNSATFGKWCGYELSAGNRCQLWIPPGFAHGFLVLTDFAEFTYKCTDYYAPDLERSIRWDDPAIGIQWPLPPGVTPLLSARDSAAAPLAGSECLP